MEIFRIAKDLGSSFKRFIKRFHHLDRETIAGIYLKGNGIEIGALHCPLTVSRGAHVKYVDRLDLESLQRKYPEVRSGQIVRPDIIDEGEELRSIADGTLDFVIANSFFEHCQNPVRALGNFMRVLKRGGVLYLAIPDKRFTFDVDRQVTPLEHILKDYEEGPELSRLQHLREWYGVVCKLSPNEVEKRLANEGEAGAGNIHWHVWTQKEMFELVNELRERFHYEVDLFLRLDTECIFILIKQ